MDGPMKEHCDNGCMAQRLGERWHAKVKIGATWIEGFSNG